MLKVAKKSILWQKCDFEGHLWVFFDILSENGQFQGTFGQFQSEKSLEYFKGPFKPWQNGTARKKLIFDQK